MLSTIREFFDRHLSASAESAPGDHAHRLQVATGALLIELARADFDVADEEVGAIADALRERFGLNADETDELVRLAEEQARGAHDYYQFTSLINEGFDPEDKVRLIELMWQVAYTDGRIDKYEDHLIRKIAGLLHVSHTDFIAAKHRARDGR